ncbi:hypothetical protein [Kitasatospora griseola]|uniref:hypothetical protein n=1 Tax=Kitasatospora griseola TaxID=2064 RepID=UPI0006990B7F|nr:hypothetical protein [Kitasatospora griseola]
MDLSQHLLVRKLMSLRLPTRDYVVAGSGPLLAHGLKDDIGDLDLVARGTAWEIITSLVRPVPAPSGHGVMALLFDGEIEAFDMWLPGTCGRDELIEEAELIQGIPFSPLRRVLGWKQRYDRSKDRADVARIREYLADRGESLH